MPQEYIDQFLRVGSNTEDHRTRIAIEYSKQPPQERLVAFVEKTYHGGYGLQFDGTKVCAWYAEDGIHIAYGSTARYARNAQIVSWEDVAVRVGELLEQGQFATNANVELAEMRSFERKQLAQTLWYMERDISKEALDQGHMSIVHNLHGGFPDDTEKLMVYLSEPESYEAIMKELYSLQDGYVIKLELPELKEMVSLLRYSSNNINQLTKRVHETGRIYDADLEDIRQGQERLWDAARKIIFSLAKLM